MNINNESNWYPPSKYIFKPMYHYFRKETGNKYYTLTITYASSILIHAIPLAIAGKIDTKIAIIGLGGIGLSGLLKFGANILKDDLRKNNLEKRLGK